MRQVLGGARPFEIGSESITNYTHTLREKPDRKRSVLAVSRTKRLRDLGWSWCEMASSMLPHWCPWMNRVLPKLSKGSWWSGIPWMRYASWANMCVGKPRRSVTRDRDIVQRGELLARITGLAAVNRRETLRLPARSEGVGRLQQRAGSAGAGIAQCHRRLRAGGPATPAAG